VFLVCILLSLRLGRLHQDPDHEIHTAHDAPVDSKAPRKRTGRPTDRARPGRIANLVFSPEYIYFPHNPPYPPLLHIPTLYLTSQIHTNKMTVNGTNGTSGRVLKAGVWAPIPTFFDDSEELGM
jgi:hypothetical protein